jgi:P27 family predicted phage terminase small subunit
MPRTGRPRTPTNLKLLRGESRPSRVNRNEPKAPLAEAVVAPEWLSAGALEVWDRLVPSLTAQGVLTAWDRDEFAGFCAAVDKHAQAQAEMRGQELVVEGRQGGLVKNPLLQVIRDQALLMIQFGARFGLTPSDRASIKLPPKEDEGGGAAAILD